MARHCLTIMIVFAALGCADATDKPSILEAELCERNRTAFPDDARTPSLTPREHVCNGGTYRWEWTEDESADLGGLFTPVDVCSPGNVMCADYWCATPCADLGL